MADKDEPYDPPLLRTGRANALPVAGAAAVYAVYAMVYLVRGLADRIAETQLVPR